MTDRVERLLRRARNIIRTKGWMQGYYAADAHGNDVGFDSVSAQCFCAVGAMKRASAESGIEDPVERSRVYRQAYDIMLAAIKATSFRDYVPFGISTWNDRVERRKQHVLDMFGLAADQAKFENRPALKGAG